MFRKGLFAIFVIAQFIWYGPASATPVSFYNITGDVLVVNLSCSPGTLKPGYCVGSGIGEVIDTATLNGQLIKDYLNPQNEPGFAIMLEINSAYIAQVWHDGSIANPGQMHAIRINATGPLFDGNESLEEYRGLASGTATGIGTIYSIGIFPVPVPATIALLGLGLVCIGATLRKQA
jgi:hypothetical protein